MTTPTPFTEWRDPPIPGDAGASLRLALAGSEAVVFQAVTSPASPTQSDPSGDNYVTNVIAVSAPQSTLPTIAIPQPLGTHPAFDIVGRNDGSFAVAVESFGGATNRVILGRADQSGFKGHPASDVTVDYRFPRFSRGHGAQVETVTAIAEGSVLATVGLLGQTAQQEQSTPVREIAPANAGLTVILAPVPGLQPHAVLTKNGCEGPPLPSGDFLGTLALHHTGQGRHGTPQILFDPHSVYAFDVDAHGAAGLILASTRSGPQLLACDLATGKHQHIAWPQGYPESGTWIAHPSVLALPQADAFAIAFFEFRGTAPRGIRYAELNLASLR